MDNSPVRALFPNFGRTKATVSEYNIKLNPAIYQSEILYLWLKPSGLWITFRGKAVDRYVDECELM